MEYYIQKIIVALKRCGTFLKETQRYVKFFEFVAALTLFMISKTPVAMATF